MTVSDAVEEFLLYIESIRTLSHNTVIACRNDLYQFKEMKWIGSGRDISSLSLEELRLCIGELSKLNRSPASINRFISSVRSLFSYCRSFGHIKINPALELKSVKNPKRLPAFMTGPEVDKLCALPETHELLWAKRDKCLFEIMYSSGCRVSEVAGLKLSDFTSDLSSAVVTGKGNKDRRVYFEKDARHSLREYLIDRKKRFGSIKKNSSVFVNQRGTALSVHGIAFILSKYTGKDGTKHHLSPHAFRHTFATAMLMNGADVRIVQELLGHSSISTTQRYTHISTEKMIESYNRAFPHAKKEK